MVVIVGVLGKGPQVVDTFGTEITYCIPYYFELQALGSHELGPYVKKTLKQAKIAVSHISADGSFTPYHMTFDAT